MELLGEVGFDHPEEIYGAYPHQLSGGQRQRVAIAQAIACKPALLIADEPTSKLDAPLQAEIIALLARIRREHGIAIVLISHDPAIFAGFADRMAVMYAGRIVEVGNTAQIFRRPLHPYTQALVQIARGGAGSAPVAGAALCGDRGRIARSLPVCQRVAGSTRAARNEWKCAANAIRKLFCPSLQDL